MAKGRIQLDIWYIRGGGIFIVMALFWGFIFEKVIPDTFDIVGSIIAAIGVIIIFYYPRKEGNKIGISSSN